MRLLALLRFSALAGVLVLAGCATTELKESWVEPSLQTLPQFKKVFVAFRGGNAAVERTAEDALAKHLRAPEKGTCYSIFPDAHGLDPEQVRAQLHDAGFDGAVIMRVANVEKSTSFVPNDYPASYRTFGGYWGNYAAPTTTVTDEAVFVETNLYSVADGKLLYAARSRTINPDSTTQLVNEIAESIVDDLRAKKLIQ
jgi:hypothetical protein